MVNYLPSQVSATIVVTSLDVATILTISAPASIIQGQPFIIEGQLKRADTGALLEGENIALSYNGVNLGTTQTRALEGTIKYQAAVKIDEMGTFTLTANFAGSTRPGLTLGPARAQAPVTMPGFPEITPLAGALIITTALIGVYMLAKRG